MKKALLRFFLFSIFMTVFVSGAFAATIHLKMTTLSISIQEVNHDQK